MPWKADGTWEEEGAAGNLQSILNSVLGKETDQDTTSTQNTSNATTSNTDTTGSAYTDQTTMGSTTNNANTNSSTNGSQTNYGQQNTFGNTTNTGTQANTGTTTGSQSGNQTTMNIQRGMADTADLQSVFDRQSAGITPDMLAAIFEQGSRAAPQLAIANANALGARAGSNTPLAASLTQLQGDLTAKAADMNRQMLNDAGNTAGKIAELTKSVVNSGSTESRSLSSQVQDLLQTSSSQQIVDQIVASLNNQTNQSNTNTQQSNTGTNVQRQVGVQNTAGTSNTAGTQNQTVNANERKNTSTTINTGVAKNLLGMAAAGMGVAALYRAATGNGFSGAIGDFVNWLKGTGAQVSSSGMIDVSNVPDGLLTGGIGGGGVSEISYIGADGNLVNNGLDYQSDIDWSSVVSFADGGEVNFLPIDQIIKKQRLVGNPDADLEGMLSGVTGSAETPGAGIDSSTGMNSGSAGGNDSPTGGPATSAGFTINDQGLAVPDQVNVTGIQAVLGALGMVGVGIPGLSQVAGMVAKSSNASNVSAARSANVAMKDSNSAFNGSAVNETGATAGPKGTGGFSANAAEAAAAAATQAGYSAAAIGAASQAAADATRNGASAQAASDASMAAADAVSGSEIGSMVDAATGTGGNDVGPSDGGNDAGGIDSNGMDTNDYGGGFADGGEVDSEEHEMEEDETSGEIMRALGLAVTANAKALNAMIPKKKPKLPGYADGKMVGAQIKGPGNGVSDSIPATGPGGRPIKVANGEVIIPTDVVQKFGVDAFNKLIAEHHVPAAMQRAITGA